jgi:hypothetical protein
VSTTGGGRTLRYEIAETLVVLVHGRTAPSDVDWEDYAGALEARVNDITGVLVATDGAGPDGLQRGKLNDLVKQRGGGFPTAVVTDSPAARGIVTALGWFNSQLRAFPSKELANALAHVGAEAERREDIVRRIAKMRIALGSLASQ